MSRQSEYKRFVLPNMRVIVGCAGFGGVIVGGVCLYLYRSLQREYHALPFHNRALTLLKSNSMAMELIGSPIKLLGVDVGDRRSNYVDPHGNGRMKIPLKGCKISGDLYVWATKRPTAEWDVDRLEFKVKDDKNPKIFIVYDKQVQKQKHPHIDLGLDNTT